MLNVGRSGKRKPTSLSRAVFYLVVLAILIIFAQIFGSKAHASPRSMQGVANVGTIAHPAGCPRSLFCACGLAQYWGIWRAELNKVSNWPHEFSRASGPGVGVAAVRIGGGHHDHVIGIVGGSPGAWEVVDFNSGKGQSHHYTAAGFPGYIFLNVKGQGFASNDNSRANNY
jgi:hypothetical protein